MKKYFLCSILAFFFMRCVTSLEKQLQVIDNAGKSTGFPLIFNVRGVYVDSAGGVSVHLDYRNTSADVIKYLDFSVVPYNSVGDQQQSSIGAKSEALIRITGPIDSIRSISDYEAHTKEDSSYKNWFGGAERIWYNSTISCVKVKQIEITYMNGKKLVIGEAKKISAMTRPYKEYPEYYGTSSDKPGLCD